MALARGKNASRSSLGEAFALLGPVSYLQFMRSTRMSLKKSACRFLTRHGHYIFRVSKYHVALSSRPPSVLLCRTIVAAAPAVVVVAGAVRKMAGRCS